MGNFASHPTATGVGAVVADVDAVSFIGHLVAFPGCFFDGQSYGIQTGTPSEPSRLCSQGAAYSTGGIDSLSLGPSSDLCKSISCCVGERKYFSSTSLIKISNKIHPTAGLGDAEIFAVEHLPFHAIPQSVQRMEDRRKRPSAVMRKQAGYVMSCKQLCKVSFRK